jgi:hypothetical protein
MASKLWTRGNVDVVVDGDKGAVILERGDEFAPHEAEAILEYVLEEAKATKTPINRYSVYIPDIKLAKDAKTISAAAVAGAFKKHGNVALLANKFGNPFLLIAEPPEKSTVKRATNRRKVVRRK